VRKVLQYKDKIPIELVDTVQSHFKEILEFFTQAKATTKMIDKNKRTSTLLNKNELKKNIRPGGSTYYQDPSKGGFSSVGHAPEAGDPSQTTPHMKKRELKMNEKLQEKIERERKMTFNDFINTREIKLQNRSSIL